MKLLGSFVLIVVSLFALCLLSTIFGAAVGWVVGLFFADTIFTFLTAAGMDVEHIQIWEIGAALGFIGSFFKSTHTSKSNG